MIAAKGSLTASGKGVERCHADRDGDCAHANCPQNRDGEPEKSGLHCPLDTYSNTGLDEDQGR